MVHALVYLFLGAQQVRVQEGYVERRACHGWALPRMEDAQHQRFTIRVRCLEGR